MNPLPSVEWNAIESFDTVVDTVISKLEVLKYEITSSSWELDDFSTLDRNIIFIKMGLNRAEKVLCQ